MVVPKTVYILCFLFCFKIVLNCECPFKAPEPPVTVPLFNDYKPEKVVINDIDYGYPFHLGGVIVLQHPVVSGVQVFPHKCPAPYRPPVEEELKAIFADLVADNYTFIDRLFTSKKLCTFHIALQCAKHHLNYYHAAHYRPVE